MNTQNYPTAETPFTTIIKQILRSGQITLEDQKRFKAAIWSDTPLTRDEQAGVQEVYSRLQRGWLKVLE